MGMAFVDEILTHTDTTVALVERRNKPGGHWNDAYPHVRLHQPSFFYGLNSASLGSDHIDEVGPNRGLSELASGAEVLAYYDHAMHRRFLPSGRVQFFANTEYRDGMATVVPSGETFELTARVAVVDASYMNVTVPATTPPKYEVAEGATVIAPNALAMVRIDAADTGTALTVETNLGPKAATVVDKPFYDPKKSLATR